MSTHGPSLPRVSVIIPTYNRAGELASSIESVLRQTVPVSELIVVDDGSTDHTAAVVERFRSPAVCYLHQDNQGTAVARNRGMDEASGDLIAFLDADDVWSPSKLEVQLGVLEALPEVGWVASNLLVVDHHGKPLKGRQGLERAVPVFRDQGYGMEEWLATTLEKQRVRLQEGPVAVFVGDLSRILLYGNFIFPSTAVLRRDVVREAGPFEPRFRRAQDNDYFLRVSEKSPGALVTEPLVRYRMGAGDQATSSQNTLELIDVALESIARARERRDFGPADLAAYRRGQELLLRRKAYAQLSNLEGPEARSTLKELWALTGRKDGRSVGLFALSLLPRGGLRVLGKLKRAAGGPG